MNVEKGFNNNDSWNQPSTSSGKGHKMNIEYTQDELDTHIQTGNKVNRLDLERVNEHHFIPLQILGAGAYGKVFLVRKLTGADKDQLYAMKVQDKIKTLHGKKIAKHTKWEREILETIGDIPFLIKLNYAFQTESKLYLILNYVAGGDLGNHLRKRKSFSEVEVQFYIGETILALQNLHKLGIIYRDVKIENILIDESGHIVLTDFGLSKQIGIGNLTHTFCGTIDYIAPEVIRCGVPKIVDVPPEACHVVGYDFGADWWSLGILTYQLFVGSLPFSNMNRADYHKSTAERIVTTSPQIPESLGENAVDFISNLLIKDPIKRLGHGEDDAEELKRHPFFENVDWEKLSNKDVPPPFKPIIENELDVSNFNSIYTTLPPTDVPAATPENFNRIFVGYSFVRQ